MSRASSRRSLAIAIVVAWGVASGFDDPFDTAYVRVYTMMAVQGVVSILGIQALCALAIIVYFRQHDSSENPLVVIVCPIIAIVGQVYAIYLLFENIDVIAGTISYAPSIWWIALAGVVIAPRYALYLKTHEPREVRPHRPR